MPPDRPEYELSVEQELPAGPDGAPRRARLTTRWPSGDSTHAPDEAELSRALRDLAERLARAAETAGVGPRASPVGRPDRPLSELLETYRPRQAELVELLHADGELTDGEFDVLRRYGSEVPASAPSPAPPSRSAARSVEELIRTYQIASLRQAGAVRARRQISFEEYMSLKRHFGTADPSPSEAPAAP